MVLHRVRLFQRYAPDDRSRPRHATQGVVARGHVQVDALVFMRQLRRLLHGIRSLKHRGLTAIVVQNLINGVGPPGIKIAGQKTRDQAKGARR